MVVGVHGADIIKNATHWPVWPFDTCYLPVYIYFAKD